MAPLQKHVRFHLTDSQEVAVRAKEERAVAKKQPASQTAKEEKETDTSQWMWPLLAVLLLAVLAAVAWFVCRRHARRLPVNKSAGAGTLVPTHTQHTQHTP